MRHRPSPPRPPHERPPHAGAHDTEKVFGLNAALAVFARRPSDIVRIAHTREVRRPLTEMLRAAAARRVPYNELPDDELARIADSVHHEGVCLFTRPRPRASFAALLERFVAPDARGAALALDRITNPHNLGAVLRSAAYFGLDALLIADEPGAARLTPAAVRVAEGGAEHVPVVTVPALAPALARLRAGGVAVVGTDARAKSSVFGLRWPRACVVVMGNEREGMARAVRDECTALIAIPGTGAVESLNASVAAGVVLAELCRTSTRERAVERG